MMRVTFFDWLINQGMNLNPDTVILNCDETRNITPVGENIQKHFSNIPTRPVFNNSFYEMKILNKKGDLGVNLIKLTSDVWDSDLMSLGFEYPNSVSEFRNLYNDSLWFTSEMFLKSSEKVTPPVLVVLAFTHAGIYQDCIFYGGDNVLPSHKYYKLVSLGIQMILGAGSLLHQKSPIELIDYPRNHRRRELRKTGKEPSPYFRIIAPDTTQKRYVGDKPPKTNKIKLPLHIVRGHFRYTENHPIEQFNGTFWIPAHTRGDEKLGKLQTHYKIRLPE